MANLVKKLILWINEHPQLSGFIALSSCIPLAIISFVLNLEVLTIFFGVFALFGGILWLGILVALMFYGLDKLWQKLVSWAKR